MTKEERVAYRAWDEFYTQMENRYHRSRGRNNFFGHKYTKAFAAIAEMCIQYKVDVTDYVVVSFDTVGRDHRLLTPRDFANENLMRTYLEHQDKYGSNAIAEWETQVTTLLQASIRSIPNIYEDEVELLKEPHGGFRAWFRVLYPEQFSEELFDLYGELAWRELRQNVKLREFLRTKVGNNFKELEERLGRLDTFTEDPI